MDLASFCFGIFALVVLLPAAVAAGWYWLQKRKGAASEDESPFISLVGLLSEPLPLNKRKLLQAVQKAWDPRIGTSSEDSEDGFVAYHPRTSAVFWQRGFFLVHNMPRTYVEEVEEVTQQIMDLRLRKLFLQHRAWFSVDAVGIPEAISPDEHRRLYHLIARLFLELVDQRCLAIFVPETGQAFPVTEETLAALRAPHPLKALQDSAPIPLLEVAPDDPRMRQAEQQARQTWPQFVEAFEQKRGSDFAVKAPITVEDNTEFIWIEVTALEGDYIYGTLGNDPVDLGQLKYGSRVRVPVAELNDWVYFDPEGNLVGGYTIPLFLDQEKLKRKKPE